MSTEPLARKVSPSAALRRTATVAMLPPAPGRFSTTTGWPSTGVRAFASARARTSVAAPGGKATTMRTGRSGQECARTIAGVASTAPAPSSAARRVVVMLILVPSLRRALRG